MRGCCSTAESAGGAGSAWEVTLYLFILLSGLQSLKHDKIDLTSMWLPGRHTGSKINIGEILPGNRPIGTVWMGPVNALGIWEAHKIQMDR